MTKMRFSKKITAVITAAVILALAVFVPGAISATTGDANAVTYDYTDTTRFAINTTSLNDPTTVPSTDAQFKEMGIFDMSFTGAVATAGGTLDYGNAALVRYIKSNNNGTIGAFGPGNTYLSRNAQGTVSIYVTYHVKPGTEFTADVRVNDNAGWGKSYWEALACYQGKKFEMKLQASADNVNWTDIAATGDKTGASIELKATVPDDANFVRVLFPQDGNPNSEGRIFDDMSALNGVTFTPGETNFSMYNYTNVVQNYTLNSERSTNAIAVYGDASAAALGIEEIAPAAAQNVYAASIQRNYNGGALMAGWGYINDAAPNTIMPYVTYKVLPGSPIYATVKINATAKAAWEALAINQGKTFEFKMQTSPDNSVWTDLASTGDKTGLVSLGTAALGSDVKYVRFIFPQNGNPDKATGGMSHIYNDSATINSVAFVKDERTSKTHVYDYLNVIQNPIDNTNDTKDYVGPGKIKVLGISAVPYNDDWAMGRSSSKGWLAASWIKLNSNDNGNAQQYFVYEVMGGSEFSINMSIVRGTTAVNDATRWEAQANATFEIKLQTSPDGTAWTDAYTTGANGGTFDVSIDVPATASYVRVLLPQTGCKGFTPVVFNDTAHINTVKYVSIIDNSTYYDYTDLSAYPLDNSLGIGREPNPTKAAAALDMYRIAENPLADGTASIDRSSKGAIGVDYGMVNKMDQGTAEFYLDYHVLGGSVFKANVTIGNSAEWGKPLWEAQECYQGKQFEITLLTSPDGYVWTKAYESNELYGTFDAKIVVPADAQYVRILFPQDGNPKVPHNVAGLWKIFNDQIYVNGVAYTLGENGMFDQYYDYTAMAEDKLDYADTNFVSLKLYEYNGLQIRKFANSMTYMGTTDAYASTATADTKPYAMYVAKPDTDVKLVVSRDTTNIAAMGSDWNVKIYESADGVNWTQNTTAPVIGDNIGLGANDTYKFTTAADTKYLKIELPHAGAVGGETGADYIGIAAFGFFPGDYGTFDPYGSYTFETEWDYTSEDVISKSGNISTSGYAAVGLYDAQMAATYGAKGNGIQTVYGYLINNESVAKPYYVYNVKGGTSFQAEIGAYTNYINAIEKKLGIEFQPKFYIADNYGEWTEYPARTVKLATNSLSSAKYTVLYTVDTLPATAQFVKIEFPQFGDMSLATNKTYPYVGNDLFTIQFVGMTKGNAKSLSEYSIDESLYTNKYDFNETTLADSDLTRTGVDYQKWAAFNAITPRYHHYLYATDGKTRANAEIVVHVKPGTAFFTEVVMRPNIYNSFNPGTFEMKILFSKDEITWTDVTAQYRTRLGAGPSGFEMLDRFDIKSIPAGINYVKIDYPNDRNYTNHITDAGKKLSYLGNDYIALTKLYYTDGGEYEYAHDINNTTIYNENEAQGISGDIDRDEIKQVLGIHDFIEDSVYVGSLSGMVDGEMAYRWIIRVEENFLFGNETLEEKAYVTYNVVPGTAFEASLFADDTNACKLDGNMVFRAYTSADGENWTEIKHGWSNYYGSGISLGNVQRLRIANVGANTNYVKIEFPQPGDFDLVWPGAKTTGAGYFGIERIRATLVNYDGEYAGADEDLVFLDPNRDVVSRVPKDAQAGLAWWAWTAIAVGAVAIAGGATFLIIFLVKKKKKDEEPKAI